MNRLFIIIFTLFIFLLGCKKDIPAGEGGVISIVGNVSQKVYDKKFKYYYGQLPAQEVDVYIVYGNDTVFSDRVKTDDKGNFKFSNLQPGKYKIFVLSDDSLKIGTKIKVPVSKVVYLKENNTEINLGNFTIYTTTDIDKGVIEIVGYINEKVYDKEFKQLYTLKNAQELDVYIVYGNDTIYSDRVKTDNKGYYKFTGLQPGTYKIFALSDDSANVGSKTKIAISQTIIAQPSVLQVKVADITIYSTLATDKGFAEITGIVTLNTYNKTFSTKQESLYAQEQDVYIIYNNNQIYSDRVRTDFQGRFKFSNLQSGKYKVFVFSEDSSINNRGKKIELLKEIEITNKTQNFIGEFSTIASLAYNKGHASIIGKIRLRNYKADGVTIKDYSDAQDYDVFITEGSNINYADKISTDYKGEYKFVNLLKGQYTVYFYSETPNVTQKTTIAYKINITDTYQIINNGEYEVGKE